MLPRSSNFTLILFFFILICSNAHSFQVKESNERGGGVTTKIVGGVVVDPQFKYPWMVGLFNLTSNVDTLFCGGSVIDSTHILTAAHCTVYGVPKEDVSVQVHRHNLALPPNDENAQVRKVLKMVVHPNYKRTPEGAHLNDVAVWTLDSPLNSVTPITLDRNGLNSNPGTPARIMGWGTTTSGGSKSEVLLYTNISLVSNDQCSQNYGMNMPSTMMCAGTPEGGRDSCLGDSPLVINADTNPVQVGVVSFGNGCGIKGYPGVYARVFEFVDFVDKAIDDMSPSSKVGYSLFNILIAIMLTIVLSTQ